MLKYMYACKNKENFEDRNYILLNLLLYLGINQLFITRINKSIT